MAIPSATCVRWTACPSVAGVLLGPCPGLAVGLLGNLIEQMLLFGGPHHCAVDCSRRRSAPDSRLVRASQRVQPEHRTNDCNRRDCRSGRYHPQHRCIAHDSKINHYYTEALIWGSLGARFLTGMALRRHRRGAAAPAQGAEEVAGRIIYHEHIQAEAGNICFGFFVYAH